MNIEDRLSDALQPYRDLPVASLQLWERIEARTQRRRVAWRWVAAGAVALVIVIVGFATIALRRDTTTPRITAAAATREEFADAANHACSDMKTKLDRAVVVFPTQSGYAAVADQVLDVATSVLAQAERFPVPESLRTSYAADLADLQSAVAATNRARLSAATGDLAETGVELDSARASLNRAGTRFAVDGAERCRP